MEIIKVGLADVQVTRLDASVEQAVCDTLAAAHPEIPKEMRDFVLESTRNAAASINLGDLMAETSGCPFDFFDGPVSPKP